MAEPPPDDVLHLAFVGGRKAGNTRATTIDMTPLDG